MRPARLARAVAALVLTGALAVLIAMPSSAAEIGRDGRCPTGAVEGAASARDNEYFTIVAAPRLYVGADDDRQIDAEVSALMPMQTPLRRIEETEFRVLFHSEAKLLDGGFACGWIEKADVLPKEPEPLKVGDEIEWTDPVTGQTRMLPNPLPLKAMLRSNPESDPDDATIVKIYDKPTITSTPRADASVFGIYLIYAERQVSGDFWYWLAGEREGAHVPTRFAGWVPDDHVLFWKTQLSLFFNERADSNIYVDMSSAARDESEGALASRPDDYRERSVGEVLENSEGEPVGNIARFPILTEESSATGRGQTIYRIGFFADSGQVEQSSERGRKQQNVRNIDMLFVLDNTLSMTEYFPYVVSGVRKATDRITAINTAQGYDVAVKYAAAIYGDYESETADLDTLQFQIISRLGSPGYTEHLGRLSAIAESGDYYEDALVDKPEAGLAGLLRGITELQWSEETEFKVVVWIGDHGSRESGISERVGLGELRAVMERENVLLLPINVAGRFSEVWNNEFIRQGNELAALRGLETRVTHDDGRGGGDFLATESAIEKAIANLYVSSIATSVAIREGTNLDQTLAQRRDLLDLDIPAAEGDVRRISTAICEMAFGNVGCENAARSGQFMGEGWVRYDERLENYDFWVNLDDFELDLLSRIMDLTCRGFERSSVKRNIEQAMLLVTTTLGGDQYRPDIPVGEFLRRYIFLPANHFPSILESTPDNIEEQWQRARDADTRNGNSDETVRIADPICRSAELLELAFDGKRLFDPDTDLVRTASLGGSSNSKYAWTVADNDRVVDFDWKWNQGGENNYFYLPVEFFPSRVALQ